MREIFKFLINFVCILFMMAFATGLFIGSGFIVNKIFPAFTLFQSSILCLCTSFLAAFIIFAIFLVERLPSVVAKNRLDFCDDFNSEFNDEFGDEFDEDFDEDFDDKEVDDEEFSSSNKRKLNVINTKKKVGRNEPCPCGSGKKYKYCCGR